MLCRGGLAFAFVAVIPDGCDVAPVVTDATIVGGCR
jgi:hypothetical protein